MADHIYFSHGIFLVYDSSEGAPGNDWTREHSMQGFARRPTAVNIAALMEDGSIGVEAGTPSLLNECERVVAVSIRSASGAISMSGIDPTDQIIWKGRPGWVRVTIGQMVGSDDEHLRLFVMAEEAAVEEATRIKERGQWIEGPFVETANIARY